MVCVTADADGGIRTLAAAGPVGETAETLLECV